MLTATPYTPRSEVVGGDAFASFVSPQIREAANLFQTRALTTVSDTATKAQAATDAANAYLQLLKLTASLEALSNEAGLPEAVWNSIREIQYKGNDCCAAREC